jgi:Mg-chelatase subunit ChlD
MNRIKIRALLVPMFAFVVGVTSATALIAHSLRPTPVPPPVEPEQTQNPLTSKPSLEMVFVIDTTGSMSGLIEGAKQKIWSIVNEVMQASSRPAVSIGLVAYRDRGDEYITQVTPLTNDLDQIYTTLMNYRAGGGGDTPENVRRALADGVERAGWSRGSPYIAQILFLVGDAPPHEDYHDEPTTDQSVADAARAGIIVNTIQCGADSQTTAKWQTIARMGQGEFFAIAQDGGVQAIATPYDKPLAELGAKLGSTFVAYGGGTGAEGESYRRAAREKQHKAEATVTASAPAVAAADRAVNKVVNSEAYVGDLLQAIENNSVKLDGVKDEDLPEDLRKMSAADRKVEVEKRLAARKKLREEIMTLSKQRDDFILKERKKTTGSASSGFDTSVARALKAQMAKKGIK